MFSASAFAQKGKTSMKEVKALYKEGKAFFHKNQYPQAIKKMRRSLFLLKNLIRVEKDQKKKKRLERIASHFSGPIAIAYHWNKDYLNAHVYYTRCEKKVQKKKKLLKLCKKYRPEVQKHLAFIKVESKPKDADIQLAFAKKKPFKIKKPVGKWFVPGTVDIKVSKKGYTTLKRKLVLRKGVKLELVYQLRKPSCKIPIRDPEIPVQLMTLGPASSVMLMGAAAPPMPPGPFSSGGWPVWKIAAVSGGVAIGIGALTFGGYQIYNRRYNYRRYTTKGQK